MALLLEAEGVEAEEALDEEGAVVVEPAPEDPPPETMKGEVSGVFGRMTS
jgi:hypothetical protein